MTLNQTWFPLAVTLVLSSAAMAAPPQYVIAISVDGMGSKYVDPMLTAGQLPTLAKFIAEGATTLNARDDADVAVTLPNHVGMVTSRGMNGVTGHNWTLNGWPDGTADTIAKKKGSYVASVFDVVHDNAMRTGMWAGKVKFNLITTSYDATNGAAHITGAGDGKNKLDTSSVGDATPANTLTTTFITAMNDTMNDKPYNFSFVHYQDPDAAGHASGWGSDSYKASLIAVDTQIGNLVNMITSSPLLNGKTVIIVTADHGGHGNNHGDITLADDYTIPFMVWGAGVGHGDLYTMNPTTRLAPSTAGGAAGNPGFADALQPIRNLELGNLSLQMLGLPAITGSTVNVIQNLAVAVPEPTALAAIATAGVLMIRRRRAA